MRKIGCIALALLLCASCALADGYDAVNSVKTALALMSYGEYEEAAQALGLDGEGEEMKTLAQEQMPELFSVSVQTQYAAAWLREGTWYVAVPVEEPEDDYGSCLVVLFDENFEAYSYCAMTVSSVLEEADAAEKVVYDEKYERGSLVLVPDRK